MMRAIVIVSALAACGGQGHQHVAFAKLLFEMPSDWSSQDSSRRGVATAVWTPDENEAKESITVVRTEMAQAVAHAGSPSLDAAVASAVGSLPSAHARTVLPVVTKHGLQGVRVDVDYVPPAAGRQYHRVHIVLVDHAKATLINVMYTAVAPDSREKTLDLVLDTIREGEG